MDSSSTIWDVLPEEITPPSLGDDVFWHSYQHQANEVSIHVAILANPYLEAILRLEKTIESRFSLHRRQPYGRVKKGDVILLKQTSGPIKGIAYVENVWFFEIKDGTLDTIKRDYGDELQIHDEAFWLRCEQLAYATLVKLTHVKRIPSIKFSKRDRNAWTIFNMPMLANQLK